MPIVPTLRRLRQEDREFEASLGYIVRHCLKIEKKKTGRKEGRKKGKEGRREGEGKGREGREASMERRREGREEGREAGKEGRK
jgi:hypothetical protein